MKIILLVSIDYSITSTGRAVLAGCFRFGEKTYQRYQKSNLEELDVDPPHPDPPADTECMAAPEDLFFFSSTSSSSSGGKVNCSIWKRFLRTLNAREFNSTLDNRVLGLPESLGKSV